MERMIAAQGRLEVLAETGLYPRLRAAGIEEEVPPAEFKGSDRSPYQGRGRPTLLRLPDTPPMVVKALRHGGLLAPVLRDWFLGPRRLEATVALIHYLESRGVPTPRLAFARIRRHPRWRLLCRLELATYEVRDSQDLRRFLERRPAAAEVARVAEQVGRLLRLLHDAGVDHADLNLKNLLRQSTVGGELLVLDLEGSRRFGGGVPGPVAVANWARLYRSLLKEGVGGGVVRRRDLVRCLRAYDRASWRQWWSRTGSRFRRTALLHRLSWWLGGRTPPMPQREPNSS